MAQGRGKHGNPKIGLAPVKANEQVIPQSFAVHSVRARCLQQVRTGGDPHPPQFKLPVKLVFICVDVVDQSHRGIIDGHAVGGTVHRVGKGHFNMYEPHAVDGGDVGVFGLQILVLCQALQRHPAPQCVGTAGQIQPVADGQVTIRPRCAPLNQRVILPVGNDRFFADRHVNDLPVRHLAQHAPVIPPDHLPAQPAVLQDDRLQKCLAAHHGPLHGQPPDLIASDANAVHPLQFGRSGIMQAAVILGEGCLAQLVHDGIGQALAGVLAQFFGWGAGKPVREPCVNGVQHLRAGNIRQPQGFLDITRAAVHQRPYKRAHRPHLRSSSHPSGA